MLTAIILAAKGRAIALEVAAAVAYALLKLKITVSVLGHGTLLRYAS